MPNVSASCRTPEEAIHELERAWQLMKEYYQAGGEEVPVAPSRKNTAVVLMCESTSVFTPI